MKSSECQQKERNNTKKLIKVSNQSVIQDTYLINHISKLAADHDVTVSGTMIKVTYKKSSTDQLASSNCVNGICYNDDSMSIPNNKFIDSMIKVDAFMDQGKTSIRSQTGSTKSDSGCTGLADSRKKAPILLGGPSGHPLLHSTPKRDSGVDDKKLKGTINGISLLKKFESLKELSGINSHNKSTTTMKPKVSATQISLPQKPIQVKAGTSDKFQGSLPTIKIPKGITIIRVKGNAMPRDEKIVRRTNSDKIILSKERRKQNINVKRKIPMADSVVATKIVKKIEPNPQVLKSNKQLKNYSDITGLCETIISEDINEDSLYSSSNSGSKKEILLEDPELPQGWRRVVHTRYEGTPFAKHVVYIYSPQGKKFQFKWKLRRYLERMKSPLSAEQFHFGLYKRAKPLTVLPVKDSSLIENDSTLNIKSSVPKTQLPSSISRNLVITKPKAFNLKHSDSRSINLGKRLSSNKAKAGLKNKQGKVSNSIASPSPTNPGSDQPQLLFYDPDLPFGWKRVINSKSPTGKLEVNIISPEGKIFRRRYRLHEYLNKHNYSHSLDRFYFGLYPKKDPLNRDHGAGDNINKIGSEYNEELEESDEDSGEELNLSESDMSKFAHYATPMYDDPNLPEGWKRFIKIRACGRNAGKMEVVIVSPGGKRIRSKGQLENYIQKNELNYNPNDFNFSVFGHPKKRPQVGEPSEINIIKRRNTDRPIPDFDINAIKESKVTMEGEIINEVAGIMISCGLSSGRSERRLRIPRKEHEKNLKAYLESDNDISFEGSAIPTSWIQKLVKCRSDFRSLEADAAMTIANSTKEFIKELSLRAFEDSDNTKSGLQYENLANIVDKYESLSYLKTLIPRKISYKEYLKLNRPKQFLSFT